MQWPKFDWKNIDWFSPKPSKERTVIGVVLIAVAALGYYAFGGAPAPANAPQGTMFGGASNGPNNAQGGGGAPNGMMQQAGAGPVPLQPVQAGQCRTLAPDGWRVVDQNQQGTVFTVSDGSEFATYAGLAVNSAQARGVYGDQYRTPEALALFFAGAIVNEQAQLTSQGETIGPYKVINFSTPGHSGYALIYSFPVAADPGGYGVIMRIALGRGGDQHSVASAGSVAAAIRCAAVVIPRDNSNLPRGKTSIDRHGTDSSSDGDLAGTYNAQLGVGWVHNSQTGRNYRVDVTTDYHDTGPDGPGYYDGNGNKLDPGFQN
jgi:hypothetical protein